MHRPSSSRAQRERPRFWLSLPGAALGRGIAQAKLLALTVACAASCIVDREPAGPEGEQALSIVWTDPPARAELAIDGVSRIDLCFSHTLDPGSVSSRPARMYSGQVQFALESELQLYAWRPRNGVARDPATIDVPDCPGSILSFFPRSDMPIHVGARLILHDDVRAWNGARLDTFGPGWTEIIEEATDEDEEPTSSFEYTLPLTLVPGESDPGPRATAPTRLRALFEPGGPFSSADPSCSCHRDATHIASAKLDLSSPKSALPALGSSSRGDRHVMVVPGRPEQSYLVQKLVHTPEGTALRTLTGQPMPPTASLSPSHRALIARWIAEGAHL